MEKKELLVVGMKNVIAALEYQSEKMPVWKDYIVCDTNYMMVWKSQQYGRSKKTHKFPGVGGEKRDE